jgi:hypothetical protein
LNLLPTLLANLRLVFCLPCLPRTLPTSFTILALPSFQFGHAILQKHWTQRPIGLQRSFIASWVVGSLEITSTSFKSVGMAIGSMVTSFPPPLDLMPQFLKPSRAALSTVQHNFTWMPSTWILPLETVSWLAGFVMLSSLSITRHTVQLDFWPSNSIFQGYHLSALLLLCCGWVPGMLFLLRL